LEEAAAMATAVQIEDMMTPGMATERMFFFFAFFVYPLE
jgi:hypothetical protein